MGMRGSPLLRAVGFLRKSWGSPPGVGVRGYLVCPIFLVASAVILVVIAGDGVVSTVPAWLCLLVLASCLFMTSLGVRFSSGAKVDTSDILLAVALASVGSGWIPVFALALAVLAPLFRTDSWFSYMFLSTQVLWMTSAGAFAVYLWRAGPGLGNPVWNSVVLVALVFLAFRLSEIISFSFDLMIIDRIWRLRPLLKSYGSVYGGSTRELLVMSVSQAPIAALAVVAVPLAPASCLLLLLPFSVSLQSALQAVRLEDAELRAGTDPLTGLANRARFFSRVELEIESAKRYGHELALIMGDLDNFKRVNDTRGHLAGDHVLRATAASFQRVIDESLFPLARYGGEEFVIVLPAADRQLVLETAEKVRHCIEGALEEWNTSISLGVAYLQEDDRLESLIDRADKALYSAKYAGKNRVHEWAPASGLNCPSPVAQPGTARDAAA